ncbi:Arc family DNA-binding protein [Serratia fonticola]|uniref:Arc family DNA-binding protein n=1 Tax=Serratia fonticola TaxID=47917 RepID=UPI00164887EA|nr:Arc family DNA-binding protein [Serratia fonticola]MBC3250446.1 Arc family DNA-binding protein [Serratia fonticola]
MARTDPQFNVRMPAEIKQQLTNLAATNRRSINAEIIAAIQAWIKSHREQEIPSVTQRLTNTEKQAMDVAIEVLTKIREENF